ncbi:hypothetical protein GWI33_002166 [Rhynchophorus ferrugineus]|uniref:deoxyhypusine monooxygenase n=1 Tax=Rhynchophorus ferrugineus TaxID=354439 RepID=A0A834MFY2_RHYFE|nr:hypothetical protein GWI33_002166 [Rhynchophorus ferrugineus]
MLSITDDQIRNIGKVLNDPSRPLKERFRALFTLRNIGGPISIECIEKGFGDPSALLKHELAYCLGQMQDTLANPILIRVLEDVSQEPMVRHEAAEALGAIGSPEMIKILEQFKSDPVIEVAETCELALERIKWLQHPDDAEITKNPYNSVDPAPPANSKDVTELKALLLNESQLQDGYGIRFLRESLENCQENEMVRHECAEALGAIATNECMAVLNKYLGDEKRVVKESCEIALDMCEYENSPEFQYANALINVT